MKICQSPNLGCIINDFLFYMISQDVMSPLNCIYIFISIWGHNMTYLKSKYGNWAKKKSCFQIYPIKHQICQNKWMILSDLFARNKWFIWWEWMVFFWPGINDLFARKEWFICQERMICLPGKKDLFARKEWFRNDTDLIIFALAFHFIKVLGSIQFFWLAVPMINHLIMIATSGRLALFLS